MKIAEKSKSMISVYLVLIFLPRNVCWSLTSFSPLTFQNLFINRWKTGTFLTVGNIFVIICKSGRLKTLFLSCQGEVEIHFREISISVYGRQKLMKKSSIIIESHCYLSSQDNVRLPCCHPSWGFLIGSVPLISLSLHLSCVLLSQRRSSEVGSQGINRSLSSGRERKGFLDRHGHLLRR